MKGMLRAGMMKIIKLASITVAYSKTIFRAPAGWVEIVMRCGCLSSML